MSKDGTVQPNPALHGTERAQAPAASADGLATCRSSQARTPARRACLTPAKRCGSTRRNLITESERAPDSNIAQPRLPTMHDRARRAWHVPRGAERPHLRSARQIPWPQSAGCFAAPAAVTRSAFLRDGDKYGEPLEAGFLHRVSDVIFGAALLECCLTVRAGRADGTDAHLTCPGL